MPLKVAELTERMLAAGAWSTSGKTPAATVESGLAVDIKRKGDASRFVRVAPRTYALRAWPEAQREAPISSGRLTYLDSAEKVLEELAGSEPMHYRDITAAAIERGYIAPEGLTPAQTMYVQLMTDVKRRHQRAEEPRFTQQPGGIFGLAKWISGGLISAIAQHNRQIKDELLARLRAMDPFEFEELIGRLLTELGFEDVVVTRRSKDGGIDVRGVFVAGEVIRTDMAIQVKRWGRNVRAPDVQKLRGALDPNEQGLLITTSGYEKGARTEATLSNRQPIGLMDGEQLVTLLVQYEIGIKRVTPELLEPAELGVPGS
ncbi:MAG: restriction endonuclease [Microbacterium sp.]|nr:restriction endonuclease [Microbacterium sp.]